VGVGRSSDGRLTAWMAAAAGSDLALGEGFVESLQRLLGRAARTSDLDSLQDDPAATDRCPAIEGRDVNLSDASPSRTFFRRVGKANDGFVDSNGQGSASNATGHNRPRRLETMASKSKRR